MTCEVCGAEATVVGIPRCKRHGHAKRCDRCKEWIPLPIPSPLEAVICTDCRGRGHGGQAPQINLDAGYLHDREYHGGQFNNGEW